MWLTPGVIDDAARITFTTAWCWALALAVKARIGGTLVAISDDMGWLHVGVEVATDHGSVVVDVLGARPIENWLDDISMQTPILHDVDDEDIVVGALPDDEAATLADDSGSRVALALASAECVADAVVALACSGQQTTRW